jgi:hypothetical protein
LPPSRLRMLKLHRRSQSPISAKQNSIASVRCLLIALTSAFDCCLCESDNGRF